jgi:hypothetical protein
MEDCSEGSQGPTWTVVLVMMMMMMALNIIYCRERRHISSSQNFLYILKS